MDTTDPSADRPGADQHDSTYPDSTYPDSSHTDSSATAEIVDLILSADSFDAFLTELVTLASAQTEHTCSITLRNSSREPFTVVSTDELTMALDQRQYAYDRGPCLEAMATGVPVFVVDMAAESRWAGFPAEAVEMGVKSSMSYPLITGAQTIGALNMYAFVELEPDVGRNARAAQVADRAAGALALSTRIAEQSKENENLRAALQSRTVIDQAIGVLMAQQECTADEAFEILRRASQGRNIKLREVAAQVVASVQRRNPAKRKGRY